MTHVACPECKAVRVPAGNICFDCAFRTPQERQQRFEEEAWRLERARATQRDRFAEHAMGAMVTALMLRMDEPLLVGVLRGAGVLAASAYQLADAMLEGREAAQKGSSRS